MFPQFFLAAVRNLLHHFIHHAGFSGDGSHTGVDTGENLCFYKCTGKLCALFDFGTALIDPFQVEGILNQISGKFQTTFRCQSTFQSQCHGTGEAAAVGTIRDLTEMAETVSELSGQMTAFFGTGQHDTGCNYSCDQDDKYQGIA